MAKIYYDKDADLSLLEGKKIAVLGYGSQGHAHSLNLKDSGMDVVVGLYEGSKSWAKAEADGLTVMTSFDACAAADIIMMLTPDTMQGDIYQQAVKPNLTPGKTLMFSHGFNIRFGQIVPPADVDVSMIAPKAPGHRVREVFTEGAGVPGLVAVHQDASGNALAQALAYETSDIPSLTGFLTWMETDDLEIKRQTGRGDMIRVMTVHGAKGLEAPVVILPDTASRRVQHRDEVMTVDGLALWRTRADDMPPAMAAARAEAVQREMNERQRLLYVALTRAEKWLIVAAAGEVDEGEGSWYPSIEAGLREAGAVAAEMPGGAGLQLVAESWTALPLKVVEAPVRTAVDLPEIFARPAALPVPVPEVLSPSDLGGAKALAGAEGEEEEAAKSHGSRVHLLLEHLPRVRPEDRKAMAEALLAPGPEAQRALAEALSVLERPALAALWDPEVLAEVPVTADIRGRRIHGIIDRLLISETEVLAVDFKTNATVPATPEACPEGILRQMGAYVAALAQIWPDRSVATAVVWTRTGEMMRMPHDLVTDALGRTPHLDAGATDT